MNRGDLAYDLLYLWVYGLSFVWITQLMFVTVAKGYGFVKNSISSLLTFWGSRR